MLSRPICKNEVYFLEPAAMETTQLAIKFETQAQADECASRWQRSCVGPNVHIENGNIVAHTHIPPVFHIPSSISDPQNACDWIYLHCTRPPQLALASICVGNRIVAYNANHIVGDGGYLTHIYKTCCDPNLPDLRGQLPIDIRNLFASDYFKQQNHPNEPISRITGYKFTNPPPARVTSSHTDALLRKVPSKTLTCYNSKIGQLKNLTDNISLALIGMISAHNGKLNPKKVGCVTCVDLRSQAPKYTNPLLMTNIFSSINVVAHGFQPSWTWEETTQALRKDLKRKIADGEQFRPQYHFKTDEGLAFLSNIGPLKIKRPVEDFCMQMGMVDGPSVPTMTCLLTYSKIREEESTNDVLFRLRYSPSKMAKNDVQPLLDSLVWALQNISPSMNIEEAIEEISQFQSQISKNL